MCSRRVVTLNLATMQPFEIGARLNALLAYPGEGEAGLRTRVANAICADQIAVTIEDDRNTADDLRRRYPDYHKRDNRVALDRFYKRRDDAILTAYIAITYLKEVMEGTELRLPEGVCRRSVPQMARHVMPREPNEREDSYENRIDEFVERTWPMFQPVAHLSTAYLKAIRELGHRDGLKTDYQELALHRYVVHLAAEHARHFRANPLTRWAHKLIEIEWIEEGAQFSAPGH
jgi:hypothetical protein